MIEFCRDHASNAKRWRDGQMGLRWWHLPSLRAALEAHFNQTVTPNKDDQNKEVAA
jgi:hypothetical protein